MNSIEVYLNNTNGDLITSNFIIDPNLISINDLIIIHNKIHYIIKRVVALSNGITSLIVEEKRVLSTTFNLTRLFKI